MCHKAAIKGNYTSIVIAKSAVIKLIVWQHLYRNLCVYASVGGAPEAYGSRHVCVCLSVCVYVFHAYFSATAKS